MAHFITALVFQLTVIYDQRLEMKFLSVLAHIRWLYPSVMVVYSVVQLGLFVRTEIIDVLNVLGRRCERFCTQHLLTLHPVMTTTNSVRDL